MSEKVFDRIEKKYLIDYGEEQYRGAGRRDHDGLHDRSRRLPVCLRLQESYRGYGRADDGGPLVDLYLLL